MKRILNIWKQRNLTSIGKNLLINSLSSSLFIFNAQIEIPPTIFIKMVEKVHKDFLWTGVPKIAHNTLIASYKEGGIKYRDLNCYIAAVNVKFIQNIARSPVINDLALPNLWLKQLFKIPVRPDQEPYFYEFFQNRMNI